MVKSRKIDLYYEFNLRFLDDSEQADESFFLKLYGFLVELLFLQFILSLCLE